MGAATGSDPVLTGLGILAAVFVVGFAIFATLVLVPYETKVGEDTKACMDRGGVYVHLQCASVMK